MRLTQPLMEAAADLRAHGPGDRRRSGRFRQGWWPIGAAARRVAIGGVALLLAGAVGCALPPDAAPTDPADPTPTAQPAAQTTPTDSADPTPAAQPAIQTTSSSARATVQGSASGESSTKRADTPAAGEMAASRPGARGLEREVPLEEPTPGPVTRDPSVGASAQGAEYTWRDGDVTRRVRVQLDLVSQPSSQNRVSDVVVVDGGGRSIVRKRADDAAGTSDPVFRAESGQLMTLPGGVLVMLDGDWDSARIERFFSENSIAMSRVEEQIFAPNAFLVSTDPGFSSLQVANALAGQDGVIFAVPDWQTETTER